LSGALEREDPKVLIVDDDEALCSLLNYKFSKRGFEIVRAFDGMKALEYIGKVRFDLMILDLMMPKLDGSQLLRRINEGEGLRPRAVIILSARGDEDVVVEAFNLGAIDYVTKPFSMDVLMARVDVALKFKSSSAE
jgi:two-component system phosphate regulon response regulator PhoB